MNYNINLKKIFEKIILLTVFLVVLFIFGNKANASGVNGFITQKDGSVLYYIDGVKKYGWQIDEGKWYFLDRKNGIKKYGWQLIDGKWYFLDRKNGDMKTGWQLIDGKWYFLDRKNGDMEIGWQLIDGKWYFLDRKNGDMEIGWQLIDGKWYYLDRKNGDMKIGWQLIDGKWYYLDRKNGDMKTGWLNVDSAHYFLHQNNGNLIYGDFEVDGVRYYTDKSGKSYLYNKSLVPNSKTVYSESVSVVKYDLDLPAIKSSSPKIYTIGQFEWHGVIYWGGHKFTYYSERVLPGGGLSIPGRYTSQLGYVTDKDGYIVLASNIFVPKGTVIDTPFGAQGKVYDRCESCSIDWFDVYTR
ncbi:hypothetical protein ABGF48_00035 [Helcococcus bovis]|uniref:hypothetical protein n=1 Tax=Helcococcus bovis TaxID=3153252 RepID=UPI0038B78219